MSWRRRLTARASLSDTVERGQVVPTAGPRLEAVVNSVGASWGPKGKYRRTETIEAANKRAGRPVIRRLEGPDRQADHRRAASRLRHR